jgi:putative aldouronate transport system substrate-binding protein
MKMSLKSITALFLMLFLMTGLISGCQDTEEAKTPTRDENISQTQTPQPDEQKSTGKSDESTDESGLLAEPGTEVTVWHSFSSSVVSSFNDSNFIDYLEEKTGVRLRFIESPTADATINFNLMLSSGDFPDIIRQGNLEYPGGGDKAIEDGVYLRLNELIEEAMPNYSAIRAKGENYSKMTISDSGNIWAIWSIKDPAEPPWMGLGIRKDILDKYGIELPVTLDDWEVALTVIRDDGVQFPLILNQSGVMYDSEFLSAWDIGRDFYQIDGKVHYGYTQTEFREYLTLMNKWYKARLIDQDFIGKGVTMFVGGTGEASNQMNLGNVGAFLTSWGFSANRRAAAGLTEINEMWIEPVQAPVLNKGDRVKFRFTNFEAYVPNAISTGCKDPVLVAKLMDYLYSEEGTRLMNYGKEGISYIMVDGKPRYTDIILHDPDGFVPRDIAMKYMWDDGIGIVDYTRLWQPFEETAPDALKAYEVWNRDGNEYVMPPISLTDAEGEEFSTIMGDINTFVTESITSFIMGSKSLTEFDNFVEQIKSMNIERAIEIQQEALDRFNAR